MSTFSNGIHNPSWFIWDYIEINNEVIGAYLLCNKISDHDNYGRQLALKNLQQRGNAAGAFLPVYKDYGKASILSPLDKSRTFRKWADTITIQDKNDLEKWFKESLPQRVSLGKYTAYCHLGRGATHMAVVLVKSIKVFVMPKWLISVDIFTLLILFLVIYFGIVFKKWPQISLTTRFALSYFLASVLPLSLICVSAYGYMLEYYNTIINKAASDLQSALKSFDHQKVESVKKYRAAFIKAINDEKLAQLIKENGIKEEVVARRVFDIFEPKLPILGVKILDEAGEGAFLSGSATTTFKIEPFVESIIPSQVNLLRDKLKEEFPDAKLKEYKGHEEESFDSATYKSFTGDDLDSSMSRHFSIPIARKNGSFESTYDIFDYIKIDGKVRYMLFVVWDDKTIDDEIIQNAFDNYTLSSLDESSINKDNQKGTQIDFGDSKLKHNFIACKIKGQSLDIMGKTRQASEELIKEAKIKAKIAITSKKTNSSLEKDNNNIIVAMPALNFNQTVFVGWESMNDIDKSIRIRILILVLLILFSLYILWLCSRRSADVFLKPVSALKGALDEVSSGNLKVGFNNKPRDELGKLSREFSKMIEGLRERERLSKIISDQAVKAIEKNSNGLLNDTETFKGVALVSDIRNFTGTSENPEFFNYFKRNFNNKFGALPLF